MMYEIIYGDFPWPYTSFGTAKLPYAHMTEEEIASFDFAPYMAKRCVLFLWVTGPKMDLAFRCVEAWKTRNNLRYIGVPYVWVKTRKDGQRIGASGPRPTIVKPLGEFVIALTNVKRGRPHPLLPGAESQVQWCSEEDMIVDSCEVYAPKPKRGVVRTKIEELYGSRTRIELFARGPKVGNWDGHGNEYTG